MSRATICISPFNLRIFRIFLSEICNGFKEFTIREIKIFFLENFSTPSTEGEFLKAIYKFPLIASCVLSVPKLMNQPTKTKVLTGGFIAEERIPSLEKL